MKCSLSGAGGAELPLPSQVVAGAVLRMAAACITTVGRAGTEAAAAGARKSASPAAAAPDPPLGALLGRPQSPDSRSPPRCP